jgi:dTDP-4-dehydrorhamnose reductase
MKILLIGANGQLASDLAMALTGHEVLPTIRQTSDDAKLSPLAGCRPLVFLDICDVARMREVIDSFGPELVINTAAFHRVDDIERDASQALQTNALAVQQLALACHDADAALVHISTDYVFDGAKRAPYVESDLPNPLSAYGATKLAGELLIRAAWHKHYIVRTCGLYGLAGSSGKGGNFVNTMLRLASEDKTIRVVDDQICTPTFTLDLCQRLADLIQTCAYGTYHATNDGQCSWHEFAREIFRLAGLQPDLRAVTSEEFGAPARRPPYSVLDNCGLKRLGIDHMRPWREALAEYLRLKLAG